MLDRLGELRTDRSARPVAILSPSIKIGGIFLGSLCLITGLWATLAKVPVRVNGIAVLVSSEGVFQVTSPSVGRMIYPIQLSPNDGSANFVPPRWDDQAYAILYSGKQFSSNQIEQLALDITKTDPDRTYPRFSKTSLSGGAGSGGLSAIKVKQGELIAIIDNPVLRADIVTNLANLQTQRRTIAEQQQLLERTLRESNSYSLTKAAQVNRLERLYKQGGISESDYLSQIAEVQRSRQSISDLRSRLADLNQTIEIQQKDLYRALATFLSRSLVFAKDDGEISQILLNQNAEVGQGQVLMTINWKREVAPDQVPVFLNQQAASQVGPGMETIATPIGFSAAEIGGMVGKITSLDPYPVGPMEISNRLGSQAVAQLVTQSGGFFQADMQLTREEVRKLKELRSAYRDPELAGASQNKDNRAGYRWNNKSKPPISPREGFLLATQITTRYRTPLEMLMPAIRETFGLNTPDKLVRQSLNQPQTQ